MTLNVFWHFPNFETGDVGELMFCILLETWGAYMLNPFTHISTFWQICSSKLLKLLWQKKKFLIMQQRYQNASVWGNGFPFFILWKNERNLVTSFSLLRFHLLNPFPLEDTFWRICRRRLLKTFWQNEKLLMMSNFYICHNVFNYYLILLSSIS